MKTSRAARAVTKELVGLLVDDWVTFAGGAVGLALTYLLAHATRSLRPVAGFVAFGFVWLALAVSLMRAAREHAGADVD